MNKKSKIIALATAGIVAVGGVAFAFKDQFLSDKSLYMKIEKENIEMLAEKFEEIKEEDLLGMFFIDDANKSTTKTDISLNISGKDGNSGKVAGFFNSLKLSITDDVIQKDDYSSKKIAFSHKGEELIGLNIVNDEETVGISLPKLYDKWIISDMSLAEVISEIIKSDEGTGTTNTLSMEEIKSVLTLSKTEKQDFKNALKYHTDKIEKTLNNVTFTKVEDDTFTYDKDSEMTVNSIRLDLSEIETLARLSQMLTKVKEDGQLLELFYNKVEAIKTVHGEKNILTDNVPAKSEVLKKINGWLNKIDARLAELNIEDTSALFDEDDNFVAIEGMEDNYYSMVIYYDHDYKILKREIYIPDAEQTNDEADYEIICVEDDDEKFYMFKRPDEIIADKVTVDGQVSTHNLSKSYYKESYSFEGFKLTKVPKWIESEKFLTIEVDSRNDNQKIISVEIPSIKSFKLFADIERIEEGRNEISVITKMGLDIKGEKQYLTINKNINKKASISKVDIYSNSININEKTQEKIDMIVDVVKGNTDGLAQTIKDKTGIDLTEALRTVKEVPQKAIDTYKTLNSLGIIG